MSGKETANWQWLQRSDRDICIFVLSNTSHLLLQRAGGLKTAPEISLAAAFHKTLTVGGHSWWLECKRKAKAQSHTFISALHSRHRVMVSTWGPPRARSPVCFQQQQQSSWALAALEAWGSLYLFQGYFLGTLELRTPALATEWPGILARQLQQWVSHSTSLQWTAPAGTTQLQPGTNPPAGNAIFPSAPVAWWPLTEIPTIAEPLLFPSGYASPSNAVVAYLKMY